MGNIDWIPIKDLPDSLKDREFLATNGIFVGRGWFYRRVEPDTIPDVAAWNVAYAKVLAPFGDVPFTPSGTFAAGFDYLAWCAKRDEAVSRADLRMPSKPNPCAGEVHEGFYATAFMSFGTEDPDDEDGGHGFVPTHFAEINAPS